MGSDQYAGSANPPAGEEWQIGKTAASIMFVKDATAYLTDHSRPDLSPEDDARLQAAIASTKLGELTFTEFMPPVVFLKKPLIAQ